MNVTAKVIQTSRRSAIKLAALAAGAAAAGIALPARANAIAPPAGRPVYGGLLSGVPEPGAPIRRELYAHWRTGADDAGPWIEVAPFSGAPTRHRIDPALYAVLTRA